MHVCLGQLPPALLCTSITRHLAREAQAVRDNTRTHRRVMSSCSAHQSRSVAVIGGGAAGLASAVELQREGHQVVVFEQGSSVGGVWVFDPSADSDPLGRQHSGGHVHSSMYANLRTNLPREIMAYSDLPFHPNAMDAVAAGARSPLARQDQHPPSRHTQQGAAHLVGPCESVDSRRYPSHDEVLRYLRAYCVYHDLLPCIHLNTHVVSVAPESPTQPQAPSPPYRWRITTQPSSQQPQGGASPQEEPRAWEFDAVVVANGHYTFPNLPDVPGLDTCPVLQLHSHNYRAPDPFADKVVLVVGASNSGEDISREVAGLASRVLLSARSWKAGEADPSAPPYGDRNNIYRYPMVERLTADGCAVFPGGAHIKVDAIIYATGYKFTFPFLDNANQSAGSQGLGVRSEGSYVTPLFRHIFPPHLAPWLSFIGLPWKVVPFPQFEIQAKVVARSLSGRIRLPSPEAMQDSVDAHFQALKDAGVPLRYAHMQNMEQFRYNAELAAMSGQDAKPLPDWREQMYTASGELKRAYPGTYRDVAWTHMDGTLQHMQADYEAQMTDLAAGDVFVREAAGRNIAS